MLSKGQNISKFGCHPSLCILQLYRLPAILGLLLSSKQNHDIGFSTWYGNCFTLYI